MTKKPTPKQKRPDNWKIPVNCTFDAVVHQIAREYFPHTKYKTVSGWLDPMLRKFYRAEAKKIREKGITLPDSLFIKGGK